MNEFISQNIMTKNIYLDNLILRIISFDVSNDL